MIILNDKKFNDEIFYFANNLKEIKNSPNNSTIIFDFKLKDIESYKYCQINSVSYGVKINSIKEFIFLINLGAKYVFCKKVRLAKKLQKIADEYLTETKVIVIVKNYDTIKKLVLYGIDGVIRDI
jgi:hypothetical protein